MVEQKTRSEWSRVRLPFANGSMLGSNLLTFNPSTTASAQPVIEGQYGNSVVFNENGCMKSKVISVKFISNDHTEIFVRRHVDDENSQNNHEDF